MNMNESSPFVREARHATNQINQTMKLPILIFRMWMDATLVYSQAIKIRIRYFSNVLLEEGVIASCAVVVVHSVFVMRCRCCTSSFTCSQWILHSIISITSSDALFCFGALLVMNDEYIHVIVVVSRRTLLHAAHPIRSHPLIFPIRMREVTLYVFRLRCYLTSTCLSVV